MKKVLYIYITFLFLQSGLYAQIVQSPRTQDLSKNLPEIPLIVLPEFSVEEYLNELQNKDTQLKAFVFAKPFYLNYSFPNDGYIDTLTNDRIVWRIGFQSKGAKTLNAIFSDLDLPENSRLFLYNKEKTDVLGSFTNKNNKANGIFPTAPVQGETLIIEYTFPKSEKTPPEFIIRQISHDFMGVSGNELKTDRYGYSQSCNVDINCEEGADWQILKRSVVKMIINGSELCSGSLINNARKDGKPYLFTARHCISSEHSANQTLVFFKYESPFCDGPDGPKNFTLSGASLKASVRDLDFALVELSQMPPESYEPYYAGWDSREIAPTNTSIIHHPKGDVKKISKDYHKALTSSWGYPYLDRAHWRIFEWDLGTTEGGSSGGPLFNSDKQIVGCLTGGSASCNYNYDDYFQKFSYAFDHFDQVDEQLMFWLDPDQTGLKFMDGLDPYNSNELIAGFVSSPSIIKAGRKINFINKSNGNPESFQWDIHTGGDFSYSTKDVFGFNFPELGEYDVNLSITKGDVSSDVNKTMTVFPSVDFDFSEACIVKNADILFTNESTEGASSIEWHFEGGEPEFYDQQGDVYVFYPEPGSYDVFLKLTYGEYVDSVYYQDLIKVMDKGVINRNHLVRKLPFDESRMNYHPFTGGSIPGQNNDTITAFAEKIPFPAKERILLNRILFHINTLDNLEEEDYLTFCVWDASFTSLAELDFPLDDVFQNSWISIDFPEPIALDSDFFAGFKLPSGFEGDISGFMTRNKGTESENSLFLLKNEEWMSMFDVYSYSASMDLVIEYEEDQNALEDLIRIYPVPGDGEIQIDLSKLSFESYDFEIIDLRGKVIERKSGIKESLLDIDLRYLQSAPYLVRFVLDKQFIVKKILIARN